MLQSQGGEVSSSLTASVPREQELWLQHTWPLPNTCQGKTSWCPEISMLVSLTLP